MIDAWQYALSSVDRGMTATAGLTDYRSGGGTIRTQDWYSLAGLARETYAQGDLVTGIPFETPIPSQAYTEVEYDYGQKYVTTADVSYIDAASGQVVKRGVTVESDELRTWNEIEAEIAEVVAGYGVLGGQSAVTVTRAEFFSPRWIEW